MDLGSDRVDGRSVLGSSGCRVVDTAASERRIGVQRAQTAVWPIV